MKQNGLSGSTLKLIAVITMLIDHVAAAVIARLLILGGTGNETLYQIYFIMRDIGRIAFPIYCFLLVEGFEHTRDRKKYALRLGMFSLFSEIPFDLAFSSKILEFQSQNVFFTLFIGVLVMMAVRKIEEQPQWDATVRVVLLAISIIAGMGAAVLLQTDYDALGVLCIMVLYIFRKQKPLQIIAGCLSFVWWEAWATLAFIPIAFYNGRRGWKMKYFFYLFYPVHLLLLYLICAGMGIAGVPAI